jgi:hypothetical protein
MWLGIGCMVWMWGRVHNIGVCSFSKEDVLPRKASFAYVACYTHPISLFHYSGLCVPKLLK